MFQYVKCIRRDGNMDKLLGSMSRHWSTDDEIDNTLGERRLGQGSAD